MHVSQCPKTTISCLILLMGPGPSYTSINWKMGRVFLKFCDFSYKKSMTDKYKNLFETIKLMFFLK